MLLKYKIHPELDYSSLKKIKSFQWEKLKETLNYAYKKSSYYHNLLNKHKLYPERIKTYSDFINIPLTTKETLRKNNFKFFAVKKEKWADCFTTGGTTGNPVYFPQTKNDLARTSWAEYRCLKIAGLKEDDIVQFNMPMSTALWGAGISYYLGYQLIGCCVLRFGPSSPEPQLKTMVNLKANVLHSNVGFSIKLGMLAKKMNINKKLKIRLLLAGLENILQDNLNRNKLGKLLESLWKKTRVCAVYGNTETAAPINECEEKQGYHLTPEFTFIEILNPETLKPLSYGEKGVIVVTTLGVEGLPLIRYLLGDVSFLIEGRCACGRTAPRVGPISGRIDEQIKIKGVIVYPSHLESLLKSNSKLEEYFIEVKKTKDYLDKLIFYIVPIKKENKIKEDIKEEVKEKFNLTPTVIFLSKREIENKIKKISTTKPKRFLKS
jgi:phenylacetate-CoA ligase